MARHAIFIGYRRDDTVDVAGRIYDALARTFGARRIFKDVDNLRPGAHFGDYIKTVLPQCRVFLALIGPNWLEARDERGARRIDDANDWVRIEIETALTTPRLDVVPVLVNGARMPKADELPASLRGLVERHAATIRRDPDFHDDVRRLSDALRQSVKTGIVDLTALGGGRSRVDRNGGGFALPATLLALALSAGAWVYFTYFNPQLTAERTPLEHAAAILAGDWRWQGVACGEGPSIAVDGDALAVTMRDTPTFRHAVESADAQGVRTLVVEPEQFRGESYVYRRDGDTLTLTSLADGRVDTWEKCP